MYCKVNHINCLIFDSEESIVYLKLSLIVKEKGGSSDRQKIYLLPDWTMSLVIFADQSQQRCRFHQSIKERPFPDEITFQQGPRREDMTLVHL
jgi:hypothetical protein